MVLGFHTVAELGARFREDERINKLRSFPRKRESSLSFTEMRP